MNNKQNFTISAILISIILLCGVCECKLRKEQKIGGWTDQNLTNSDYKTESNSEDPLHLVYTNLLSYLEKSQITNINFTRVQSQLVNGINYKIEFSYEQNGEQKIGNALIYVQSWTKTCKIESVTLQKDKLMDNSSSPFGGWSIYPIESNYQTNEESPLYMAFNFLNEILAKKNIKLVKFDKILCQVVNGLNFRIQFTYKIIGQEETEKKGQSVTYVNIWNRFVMINTLELDIEEVEEESLKNLSTSANSDDQISGGWSKLDFASDFKTNESNELHAPFNLLNSYLKNHNNIFSKIISVEKQLVNGFNYRISFNYATLKGNKKTGQITIYVPFVADEKLKITSVNLNIEEKQAENNDEEEKHEEGGWSEYNYQDSNNSNESSPFYKANNALKNAIKNKGFTSLQIKRVQSQVVSGVNYKIYFSYHNIHKELKSGYAVIYVQPWTNTVKITDIKFNVSQI